MSACIYVCIYVYTQNTRARRHAPAVNCIVVHTRKHVLLLYTITHIQSHMHMHESRHALTDQLTVCTVCLHVCMYVCMYAYTHRIRELAGTHQRYTTLVHAHVH